ncbi:f1 atpase assembly protein [Pyrenophora tritici-repentis]|uniref:F1 atpase assembly protein n=2 Tax=Pyrenophora tritici-repentis TaxID=45151 RepID=A0A922N1U7_9PLEO|nr:F1F0 ATP synthase assembly protein Atp11 [Pyrenophora tritici-repentis Pt-1C-BFP]EDU46122.1 F1F0 ATP synthase assembly protein Atp11 [Pyrenophora tritici-repentis Pt-1C-BFP]KAI1507978.1 f1 atpase assembly protein [Pyrenophora tritici-repentis]KAI1663806.1 f1 atpase assembly protein [Pyrenophora tritici-repentis]KAI1678137.1 f1 atpase assembly protein [Pyrenophora tritici-repentis]
MIPSPQRLGLANVDQLRHRHGLGHIRQAQASHYDTTGTAAAGVQHAGPAPRVLVAEVDQVSSPLKKLAAFLDVDKAKSLGFAEIEAVWRLRHATSASSLCAAIPWSTYERITETARAHPRFVLPLPLPLPQPLPQPLPLPPSLSAAAPDQQESQQQRATLHYLQWAFPAPDAATLSMTRLNEFQRRGVHAHPHTTATLHLELAKSNGVVLLQGEVNGIGADAARLLLMLAQRFCCGL